MGDGYPAFPTRRERMRVDAPQTRRKAGARSKAASMRRSERNAQERTTRGAGGIGGEGAKARGATPSPRQGSFGGFGTIGQSARGTTHLAR